MFDKTKNYLWTYKEMGLPFQTKEVIIVGETATAIKISWREYPRYYCKWISKFMSFSYIEEII